MRSFTRWAVLPVLLGVAFALPGKVEAHVLKCYAAKSAKADHACDHRNRHHGVTAVSWAKKHRAPSSLSKPAVRRIVVGHTWLARSRQVRLNRYHAHVAAAKAKREARGIPTRWRRIADCETGGDEYGRPPYHAVWDYNGSSGFDGGIQFSPGTWDMAKVKPEVARFAARYRRAYHAPAWVQVAVAENWLRLTSWLQWPSCSRSVGLR